MYKIILSKQVQKFLDLLSDEYVLSFQNSRPHNENKGVRRFAS